MPKLDRGNVPLRTGSIYPEPYASQMKGRSSLRLGDAGGLTQFGVNEVILQPGEKSFTDEEIKAISDSIVASAAKQGAELRG